MYEQNSFHHFHTNEFTNLKPYHKLYKYPFTRNTPNYEEAPMKEEQLQNKRLIYEFEEDNKSRK